jgi:hypothetical protein
MEYGLSGASPRTRTFPRDGVGELYLYSMFLGPKMVAGDPIESTSFWGA